MEAREQGLAGQRARRRERLAQKAQKRGRLEVVDCLANSARVMLTSNLWIGVGLVNGAMGTVQAMPIAIMVHFDSYSGSTCTVAITPRRRCWSSSGGQCSRFQFTLKLAWAVIIHKSQGLTLD